MSQQSQLQEVVNVAEKVKAFGKSYDIRKFTFGPMTQALEYVGPMAYLLQWLNELPKDDKGKIVATAEQMTALAVRAISISGNSVFGLVSIATKEPIEWLEQQDAMDGIRLFAKVVEKNLDFFSQQNIDELKATLGNLQPQIQQTGGATSTT